MYGDSNYLYMAGEYDKIGGKHFKGIARWNGIKWDSMQAGINGLDTFNPIPNVTPLAMATYQNKLYVGGIFSSLSRVRAYSMGTWDGTRWDSIPIQPFRNDADNGVGSLVVINNKLYMAGIFDTVAGQPGVHDIACWDGAKWSSLNFPHFSSWQGIYTICEYKGDIYAGGHFAGNNGAIGNIMRLDSTGWHAVDTGIKGVNAWINCMAVYNGELYVAGYFYQSDRNVGNCIQKWDGTKWSDVGGGTDYQIFNLTVWNGKLYAVGQLGEAGGIPANSIAEWDGSKWCSLGSNFDNVINTSCVYKDSLYIGGGFLTIDGDSITYMAEWTGGNYTSNCSQPAGISEMNNKGGKVEVYPNPSNGMLTLSLTNVNQECSIKVYSVLGQQVYWSSIDANGSAEINLSGQSQGVYLYRVITETGDLVREGKIILQ